MLYEVSYKITSVDYLRYASTFSLTNKYPIEDIPAYITETHHHIVSFKEIDSYSYYYYDVQNIDVYGFMFVYDNNTILIDTNSKSSNLLFNGIKSYIKTNIRLNKINEIIA